MVGTFMTRFGKILLILFGESEFTFCNTLYFRPEKLKTLSNSLFKNVMKKQAFDLKRSFLIQIKFLNFLQRTSICH